MRPKTLSLTFPLGGLHRALAYQSQPPYTCYDALNVRATETVEQRARGGSRPGLKEEWAKHADMDEQCVFLGVVDWVSSGSLKETLVAIIPDTTAGFNRLWYSSDGATWTTLGVGAGGFTLSTLPVYGAQRLQKLYISDPNSAAGPGYSAGHGGDATPHTHDVMVFDPAAGPPPTLTRLSISTGVPPDGCRLLTIYNDRLCLATKNQYYMSHMADPTDWNYGCQIDDPKRAVSSTSAETGELGEPLTGWIPLSNDLLLLGCTNSLHMIRGDLTYGGRMDPLSRVLGILAPGACCQAPTGEVYFLSRDGVYRDRGVSAPEPVSRQKLPNELLNVAAGGYTINMVYNIPAHGIHIFLTPATLNGRHWFLDLWGGGFWPDQYPIAAQPTAVCQYAKDMSAPKVVYLGCKGGYVLRFDDAISNDHDGAGGSDPINSYVLLGPILGAGNGRRENLMYEISAILDESAGDVGWELCMGDSPEDALAGARRFQGSWHPGRNRASRPFARGAAAFLKLSANNRWALEAVLMEIESIGPWRAF